MGGYLDRSFGEYFLFVLAFFWATPKEALFKKSKNTNPPQAMRHVVFYLGKYRKPPASSHSAEALLRLSMLSLFMSIAGGVSWQQVPSPRVSSGVGAHGPGQSFFFSNFGGFFFRYFLGLSFFGLFFFLKRSQEFFFTFVFLGIKGPSNKNSVFPRRIYLC